MERSYASVSSDRRQAFEVDPALHLILRNGLEAPRVLESGGITASLSLSFLGALRVFREDSAPVRTPTFEPRAKLQLFAVGRPRAGAPPPADVSPPWLAALELTVGHRSNGQQGCALAEHVRTGRGDFDCVPLTDPPSDALDLASGSFTTQYLAIGLAGQRQLGGPDRPAVFVSGRSALEWHPPCHFGACMPEPMRRRYGAAVGRLSVELELPAVWRVSRWVPFLGAESDLGLRMVLAGSRHLGTVGRPAFGDASAELAVLSRTPRGLGVGVFVRRHQGRDDLNIRFEERLDAWIAGIMLDPGARP